MAMGSMRKLTRVETYLRNWLKKNSMHTLIYFRLKSLIWGFVYRRFSEWQRAQNERQKFRIMSVMKWSNSEYSIHGKIHTIFLISLSMEPRTTMSIYVGAITLLHDRIKNGQPIGSLPDEGTYGPSIPSTAVYVWQQPAAPRERYAFNSIAAFIELRKFQSIWAQNTLIEMNIFDLIVIEHYNHQDKWWPRFWKHVVLSSLFELLTR